MMRGRHRRQVKLSTGLGSQRVAAGIILYIGAAPPMLPKFKIIYVGCQTIVPHEDELVLRPIKRTHTGIRFVPDADVLRYMSLSQRPSFPQRSANQ